jgi:nicotinamide-nucleotide adenylyltransferase
VIELLSEAGIRVKQSPLFKRNNYSGTEIRRRMLAGDRWEHFIPEKVVAIIKEIDGVSRLKTIAQSDQE